MSHMMCRKLLGWNHHNCRALINGRQSFLYATCRHSNDVICAIILDLARETKQPVARGGLATSKKAWANFPCAGSEELIAAVKAHNQDAIWRITAYTLGSSANHTQKRPEWNELWKRHTTLRQVITREDTVPATGDGNRPYRVIGVRQFRNLPRYRPLSKPSIPVQSPIGRVTETTSSLCKPSTKSACDQLGMFRSIHHIGKAVDRKNGQSGLWAMCASTDMGYWHDIG